MNAKQKIDYIVKWMQNYLNKSKAKGFVFGLSGGIDSALIAAICAKYFKDQSVALILNIENIKQDVDDQKLVIDQTKINYLEIDLLPIFNNFENLFNNQTLLSLSNLKSRLRAISLYNYAQIHSYLVIGTGNADEFYTGYFTKYGDSACDILPIVNLIKKDIVSCAKYLNIPKEILNKKPSAGLFENQYDEDELKVSYKEIDKFLLKENINKKDEERIKHLHKTTIHKRKLPSSPLLKNKIFK